MAGLARLELTDDEVRAYTAQIGEVLRYVKLLEKVDVEGIEPLTHPLDMELPLREDAVETSPRDPAADGGYKVPPIL